MDKLLAFKNKEINVVKGEFIISRESLDNGVDFIHVTCADNGKEVYSFWQNTNKTDEEPKSMGGKKPYVMLMLQELSKLQEGGIKGIEDAVGFLTIISDNIRWNTGLVVNKRSKKPLKYTDLQKIYSGSKYKFEKTMKFLKDHNLLTHTPEGYFISRELIKKGSKK
jgi:hypothetical protein